MENTNDVLVKIEEILREIFDREDLVLTMDTTSEDIEGWDSLAHIRIVAEVEAAFGVKFTFPELAQMKNVGEMVRLIESKA